METIMDLTYFIAKFINTKPEEWGTGFYNHNGKKCAYGHCGAVKTNEETAETIALQSISVAYQINIIGVNDGDAGCPEKYRGLSTPKERIIAVLCDKYEEVYGRKYQAEPEVKERIVYVMVDSTVKELSGQLTNN